MELTYNRLRLGLNIRMRRHVMDLTQEQLAKIVGCHKSTISAIERGKHDMSVDTLFAISKALAYPMHDILQNV